MTRKQSQDKRVLALQKELASVQKRESALDDQAIKSHPSAWHKELEQKIPPNVLNGLEAAFSRGFSMVLEKGSGLIEKSYNLSELQETYTVQNYAAQVRGRRKELRAISRSSRTAQLGDLALTTIEGMGLGALGIGLPDIVLFLGMLLRGIYQTALRYGFQYDTPEEKMLILKMIEAALSKGDSRTASSAQVDALLLSPFIPEGETLQTQIERTGHALAVDMLLLKFIQGLPLVGIVGGIGNPIYYHKIMNYVQLKYQKRYLLSLTFYTTK